MKVINWGILGPGRIAHKFATALKGINDAKIYAVASRSNERSQSFAKKFGIEKTYVSYDEMADDPKVDVIYIATPHSFHYEQTLMCLKKGKHVLCEKPFTINSGQLGILIEQARKNNLFLMEAIWTRFLPTIENTIDIIKSGKIGKIKVIEADFGFKAEYDPQSRVFNPDLGGGSLLDIGIYPVFLSLLLLGFPDDISAVAVKTDKGIDESMAISLGYKNGAIASLHSTFAAQTATKATIYCENGRIIINPKFNAPSSLQIIYNGQDPEEQKFSYQLNGYEGEAIEVMRCLNKGLTESPMLSWNFSIQLMELLDNLREKSGVIYPLYD